MDWKRHCAVVIPCLNEGLTIGGLVRAAAEILPTIFVVDDGSTDNTGALAAGAGARVLRHDRPRGKGAALQTGCGEAYRQGFSWAMTMDGDGQHLPCDLGKFLSMAENSGSALVIGNRMGCPDSMPVVRRWTNRFMSAVLSALAGKSYPDTQCGFRLFQLEKWAKLRLQTNHFEADSELLLASARADWPVAFVPIQAIYNGERSKIRPLRDSVRWLRWLSAVARSPHPKPSAWERKNAASLALDAGPREDLISSC